MPKIRQRKQIFFLQAGFSLTFICLPRPGSDLTTKIVPGLLSFLDWFGINHRKHPRKFNIESLSVVVVYFVSDIFWFFWIQFRRYVHCVWFLFTNLGLILCAKPRAGTRVPRNNVTLCRCDFGNTPSSPPPLCEPTTLMGGFFGMGLKKIH